MLWAGRPAFLPFLASGIPFLVIGVIWVSIDFFGFIYPMLTGERHTPSGFAGFMIPFSPCISSPSGKPAKHVASGSRLEEHRLCDHHSSRDVSRGLWGINYESIDIEQITDLQVNIGPVERFIGAGSISISIASRTANAAVGKKFIGVPDPYEVFKEIKKVSLEVKTDFEYPNKLRPDTNPGYKTAYTGQ